MCGKRGALGRCLSCGLLTHLSCLSPTLPGREPECPRCAKQPEGAPDEPWKLGTHRAKFGKGALTPGPVGLGEGARFTVRLPVAAGGEK